MFKRFLKNNNIQGYRVDQLYDQYFKQLKSIPIEDITKYLRRIKLKHKKQPADGCQLVKSMLKMQEKYGVEFLFCEPVESGKVVVDLLNKKYNQI